MTCNGWWTSERTELLVKLLADDKLSAADIAKRIGCSRNAVLGKTHRLGLNKVQQRADAEEIAMAREARKARKNAAARARYVPTSQLPQEARAKQAPQFTGSLHLPFSDLRNFSQLDANQCRFIEGGSPDFLCCGTETLPGASYCGHHSEIVRGRSINISDNGRAIHEATARKLNRLGFPSAVKIPLTHRIPDQQQFDVGDFADSEISQSSSRATA